MMRVNIQTWISVVWRIFEYTGHFSVYVRVAEEIVGYSVYFLL